ncbi:MAG: DUF1343 domain-containing protein, partial [Bacteroidales bacterium]|nr:DUF1343 domain-containing protein [Bacteroidales bacterium]
GTPISVGRGTQTPFEIIGFPNYQPIRYQPKEIISFTPTVIKGVSDNPPYKNQQCKGLKLKLEHHEGINLSYLKEMYDAFPNKDNFFQPFFDKLVGTKDLKAQIKQNLHLKDIKKTWKKDLKEFKKIREKYLIYK